MIGLSTLGDAAELHRHRHSHFGRSRTGRPRDCVEPADLPEQFMSWYNTFAHGDDGADARRPQRKAADASGSRWSAYCASAPSRGAGAAAADRTLCPWQWVVNRDESRRPKLISEARCICDTPRPAGAIDALCQPIYRSMPILYRSGCDRATGQWQYERGRLPIAVGCHAAVSMQRPAADIAQHLAMRRGGDFDRRRAPVADNML